ncbi:hypothetical protein MLD38_000384 [Melastoma candidum]|uniref:Uncharacterized protein n=1 Tax=Melastoma candidum TaxID=119954 RepID=A0ACB9SB63_9MYRT|nr:hypothetical protein MLD38_000384 [Melastoma candidum]
MEALHRQPAISVGAPAATTDRLHLVLLALDPPKPGKRATHLRRSRHGDQNPNALRSGRDKVTVATPETRILQGTAHESPKPNPYGRDVEGCISIEKKKSSLLPVALVVCPSLLVSTSVPDAFSADTDIAVTIPDKELLGTSDKSGLKTVSDSKFPT